MTGLYESLSVDKFSVASYVIGLGLIIFTIILGYFWQASQESETSVRPKAAEPYGSYLQSLNRTNDRDKPETEWLNMGYWKVCRLSMVERNSAFPRRVSRTLWFSPKHVKVRTVVTRSLFPLLTKVFKLLP
jgi:hypothetical protein